MATGPAVRSVGGMSRIALVTGANQGLGLALVRRLASTLNAEDVVYLTGRDPGRVAAARAGLLAEGLAVRSAVMDVGDDASVTRCAREIASRHGGLDIVVSNAGARISPDLPDAAQVDGFVNVNNRGTTRVLEAFAPLLRPDGRLVVVASGFGSLRRLPPALHRLFDAPDLTLAQIDATMRGYADAVRDGSATALGWPEWINIASKVGQVASLRVLARQLAGDPRRLRLFSACPGLVDTAASRPWFDDMSRAQTPDAAAVDVAWLASQATPDEAPQGELLQFRRVLPWR